ncbi:hypothetical protein HG264_04125 [Pseudomonas sp. gcc21]|uniref:hypothetical protein n=1 Tax=Pseudomonas sp. gcc21 TaxID=2726989 RepID=UPI0014525086|nr:hypothetical protein [Pseudomonas sp. gcc21]QJD58158.1 hypothetical protein HG264_04125 [Pseudomonas sp. gcc21]
MTPNMIEPAPIAESVDSLDAGSLREKYKVLMNEHQALAASYESLVRQTTQFEQALELFAKRAISICGGEAGEWDSDEVIPQKNYAQACENRIRRLRDEFRAALAKQRSDV